MANAAAGKTRKCKRFHHFPPNHRTMKSVDVSANGTSKNTAIQPGMRDFIKKASSQA
jgi:hypothetical protein